MCTLALKVAADGWRTFLFKMRVFAAANIICRFSYLFKVNNMK